MRWRQTTFSNAFFILHARTAARTYITLLALVVMPFYWFTVLNLKQTLGSCEFLLLVCQIFIEMLSNLWTHHGPRVTGKDFF